MGLGSAKPQAPIAGGGKIVPVDVTRQKGKTLKKDQARLGPQ